MSSATGQPNADVRWADSSAAEPRHEEILAQANGGDRPSSTVLTPTEQLSFGRLDYDQASPIVDSLHPGARPATAPVSPRPTGLHAAMVFPQDHPGGLATTAESYTSDLSHINGMETDRSALSKDGMGDTAGSESDAASPGGLLAAALLPNAKFSLPRDVQLQPQSRGMVRFQSGVGGSSKSDRAGFKAGVGSSSKVNRAGFKAAIGGSAKLDRQKTKVAGLRRKSAEEQHPPGSALSVILPDLEEDPSASDVLLDMNQQDATAAQLHIRLQLKEGGPEEFVTPPQIHLLAQDSEPWESNGSKLMELPTSMRDLRFLRTRVSDVRSVNKDYIVMKFHEKSEVYLLTHSILPVPAWVKERFDCVEHTTLQVDWKLGTFKNVVAYFGLNYHRIKSSQLKVWKLKEVVVGSGNRLVLPGYGHKGTLLPVFNYVVCWRPQLEASMSDAGVNKSPKYKSMEAKNEALEESVLRQDVMKVEQLLKAGADVHLTLSNPGFRGSLLTKVPAMSNNMPMLCKLLEHGAELDWYALRYVLEQGHMLPTAHAPVEHLLTNYVRTRRNPANTTYAIALCLHTVAKEHTSKAAEYSVLSEKFRMAAINLIEDLNKLSYIGGKARWMLSPDEVLEPTKHYSNHFPINLASCSSTALKLHDTDYSSTSTVQNFIERAWVGVNFIQVARTTGATSTGTATSITSHTYLLSLMSQYGFCGSIGRSIIVPFSSICHISLFAGHAYFNSPRGRWALDCLSHGLFLVLFHIALFEPKGWERQPRSQQRNGLPWDERPGIAAWTPEAMNATESNTYVMYIVFGLFLFWVLSLGIDLFNICIFQFGGSFHRFLKMESFTMKMDVLQFVTLVASTMLWGLVEMATAGTISNFDQTNSLRALKILFSISAIVVWVQTMYKLRPLNKGLAPLLYVIGLMMSEVFVFLVPLGALLLGFAAALLSLFWGTINAEIGWTSMWDVVLLLFRFFVSDFQSSVDIFSTDKYDENFEVDPVLRLYAIFILILYIIVSSILMANLLIAILTYKYDPEKIDAESKFQRVMMLEDYQAQVDNRLLPAPFSLVVSVVNMLGLPSGTRPKLPRSKFLAFLLPPLDDLGDDRKRDVGAREVPYCVYLSSLGITINLLVIALSVLVAPFCIFHFSIKTSHLLSKKGVRATITNGRLPTLSTMGSRMKSGLSFFKPKPPSRTKTRLKKIGQSVLYALIFLCVWPGMLLLGTLLYGVLAALLVLYSCLYVWAAKYLYSIFWILMGFFQGWFGGWRISPIDDKSPQDPAAREASVVTTAGPSKKWGKLLAKQRKEEFKKIAFKSEEVDTALACAGITIAKPGLEKAASLTPASLNASRSKEDNRGTSPSKKPFNSSMRADKELFNASLAGGRARANEARNLNSSFMPGQNMETGLAQGFARFDSRFPSRRHGKPPFQQGALNRSTTRAGTGAVGRAGVGPDMGGGLMYEMGGVRDDISEVRSLVESLSVEILILKRALLEESEEEEYTDGDADMASSAGDADDESVEQHNHPPMPMDGRRDSRPGFSLLDELTNDINSPLPPSALGDEAV